MIKLIVCICRGNIVRSPIAATIINKELAKRKLTNKYVAISRGIQGTTIDPKPVKFPNITFYKELYSEIKPVLKKLKIDLTKHKSIPIDKIIAEKSSIMLAMDKKTKDALLKLFPDQRKKIHLFSELINEDKEIADPEKSDSEKQEQIVNEINYIVLKAFSELIFLVNLKS